MGLWLAMEQLTFDFMKTDRRREIGDGLRFYQEEYVSAVFTGIQPGERRIGKVFTGGGKTRTGIAGVQRWLLSGDGDALWLANRTFLTEDALDRLLRTLGCYVGLEKASSTAEGTRMTVGSLQTFVGKRLAE